LIVRVSSSVVKVSPPSFFACVRVGLLEARRPGGVVGDGLKSEDVIIGADIPCGVVVVEHVAGIPRGVEGGDVAEIPPVVEAPENSDALVRVEAGEALGEALGEVEGCPPFGA
jgi:hypothetical protein